MPFTPSTAGWKSSMPSSADQLRRFRPISDDAVAHLQYLKDKNTPGPTIRRRRCELRRFEQWLEIKGRTLSNLTPMQLEHGYPMWCAKTFGYRKVTCDAEYYGARSFVIWLIRCGRLPNRHATEFYPKSLKSFELPTSALEFIEQRKDVSRYAPRRYGQLFNLFHQWLSERKIELPQLTRENVRSFLNFLDKRGYKPKPLHVRRLHLRIYLDWLRDRDLISCDCRDLFGYVEQYRNFELPPHTQEYLSELRTHLSPETVLSYATGIKAFFRYLHYGRIGLAQLERKHCVQWMEWMFEKEYSASTRLQRLVTLKGYFNWLVERGLFQWNVDALIKSDDFPKLDDMLPRPIPAQVDEEIQRRLRESDNIYHKGALLLRYTGIRLGDLVALPFNPISRDDKGRTFIKVPSGKLKKERLLPIEERTVALIESIQKRMAPRIAKFGTNPAQAPLFVERIKKSAHFKVYRHFKGITEDLEKDPGVGSLYPHRLRHTYATSLLNAGLHPALLMVLLGHTDLRMTFRYAKLSIGLIHSAYFTALDQLQKGIQLPIPKLAAAGTDGPVDAVTALQNAARWLKKTGPGTSSASKETLARIIKRIQRIEREIQDLHSISVAQ